MKKLTGVLLIGLLLTSCTKKLEYEGKVNDQWSYSYENYDSLGYITSTYPKISSKALPELHHGEIYCYIYTSMYGPYGPIFEKFIPRQDGLHRMNYSGPNSYLFLKFPATLHETYQFGLTDTSSIMTVLAVNDTLTVPYGHLEGVNKYQWTVAGNPKANFWFNPDLWCIKYEEYKSLHNGSGFYVDFSWNLLEYEED